MGMQSSFPVFEADQVLTNNHLNDLRSYLDQQNRLTRARLIGCGIVCGLEITCSSSSIKVSKGCGLTSQGYIITVCDTEFTHCIPYSLIDLPADLDFVSQCGDADLSRVPFYKPGFTGSFLQLISSVQLEKLSPETRSSAVALSDKTVEELDELAVVLFLEAEQINLKNCDTNDCNDKGSRMDFEPKALLVAKSVLDETLTGAAGGSGKDPLPQIELKRYNVPVKNLLNTSAVLSAFSSITDDSTIAAIEETLSACYERYEHLLEGETVNPFSGLGNRLKTIRNKITTTNPLFIQYFCDFLDDIIKAHIEFREKAFYLNSECCTNEMRFPLHLMLGEAAVSTLTGVRSSYRQHFIYSPLFDSQNRRLNEIRSLFVKLKLLTLTFNPDEPSAFARRTVKITPSRSGKSRLSDRCIPYYYNVTGGAGQPALFRQWDYKKTSLGEAEYNLGYKSDQYSNAGNRLVREPLLFDIEKYNFFRVEGHIGKHISSALTDVLSIKQEYNLPIEVIALSADYVGAILKGEDPQCVIQDLESDYRIIIAEFMCKLHDAFCNIYKFDFKPKPLGAIADVGAIATMRSAPGVGATAGAELAATAVIDDDDKEVNELMGKIDFAGLKADHPALSQLVSEAHLTKNYTKGSSLLKICGVRKGSVGDIYLSNISGNIFSNPVTLNRNIKAANLYSRFFELIDSIESMFRILLTNELSELDLAEFKNAYNRYEKEVNNLSKQLKVITDKVQIFLSTCIVEMLQALKDEYRRRINQYNLARKFNNYFKAHGGVEHKAGVVKGGTFILVYHEETKNNRFDVSALLVNKKLGALMLAKHPDLLKPDVSDDKIKVAADELRTAVERDCPDQYTFFNKAITNFLDADATSPVASKDALLAALRKPLPKPGPAFTNGTVIADFYVPYICCSDCTPVSYVLQPTEPLPLSAVADSPVCDAEGKKYTVKISISGGTAPYTLSVNGVILPDDTIELSSGSPDTKVTIKDAAGKTVDVTVKSHNCPAPCNLPCGGASQICRYILWVQKPPAELKIPHETGSAVLKLTNENNQVKTIKVNAIFKEVFEAHHNTVTNENYDSIFKALLAKLNAVVPVNFFANNEPVFTYDPETQLLKIDKFDCHEVKLELEVTMKLSGKSFKLKITYDKNGVFMTNGENIRVTVPPFGCIQRNKCTGEEVNKCNDNLRIERIKGSQVTFNKPHFDFSAEPKFDKYFWFFHTGIPPMSDLPEPKGITLLNTDPGPVVKLIGIKTGTGCFAILEQKVTLDLIVG